MSEVLVKVLRAAGLSDRERLAFLGYLWTEAEGVRDIGTRKTRSKYRTLARDHGVALRREDRALDVTAGLDYEEGRMTIEVAA